MLSPALFSRFTYPRLGAATPAFMPLCAAVFLSACSVLSPEPPSSDITPLTAAQAKPVKAPAKSCQIPQLPKLLWLEAAPTLRPSDCAILPFINAATHAVQPLCTSQTKCDQLPTANGQALPPINLTPKLRYSQLRTQQQQLQAFVKTTKALHVAQFGAIDGLIKRGLRVYERTDINAYSQAIIATKGSSLRTGLWLHNANDLAGALAAGHSFVTNSPNVSVALSGSFADVTCNKTPITARQLAVAPQAAPKLRLVARINGSDANDTAYIVKHWLDLSGQLYRKTLPLNPSQPCALIIDPEFDTAVASAYFLVVKDTAASTPIWYLPPRG